MLKKTLRQRFNLLNLGLVILARKEPLGVGLHNQCWAGLAIEKAREKKLKATDCYGLSMTEIKTAIKINNKQAVSQRNRVMAYNSFAKALS